MEDRRNQTESDENASKLSSARGSRHLRLRGERKEVMPPTELLGSFTVNNMAVGTNPIREKRHLLGAGQERNTLHLPSYTPLQHFPLASPC